MSLINSLQNGQKTQLASNANVTINTGNGHSNIKVTANNVSIDTGCGDQDIQVIAGGNLDIDTGFCGEDNITAIVAGDAAITTREDNDTVNMVVGGNFIVDVGMVHPECGAEDDDDKVTIVSNGSEQSYLATGQGNDTVHLIANNVDVKKNDGSLELGFIGNNYNINSDASYNMVAGWGDDVTMNLNTDGRANNNVYTFDQLWSDSNPEVNSKFTTGFWQTDNPMVTSLTLGDGKEINFENVMENVVQSYEATATSTDVQQEVIDSKTDVKVEESISGKQISDLVKQYKFDEATLSQYDLSATLSDGTPKYAVRSRYSGQYYELIERSDNSNKGTIVAVSKDARYGAETTIGQVVDTRRFQDISAEGDATKTTTTTTTKTDTVKTTTTTTEQDLKLTVFDGVSNWQVNMGNGKAIGHITARDGYININHGNACNNEQVRDIIVDSGYILSEVLDTRVSTDVKTDDVVTVSTDVQEEKISEAIRLLYDQIVSPLVLDMNGDGKVSAAAGKGVDINNDGKADGAATNGDKMLAMTDLNGNNKIDGAEVFGDQTVSPFTGKKLNAANGFEALKQIAQEAKEYTGIDCMNGSKVDVQKLQKALAKIGVNLGFVSDDNVKDLENLYGVKEIEVGNYTQSQRTGSSVEHLQNSVYTDENGVEYKVDDVWFEV